MVVFEHEFPEFEDVCLHCGITATQYEKNTDGFRCVGRNVIPPREPRTCLAADDVDVISTRLAELQAERDAMLANGNCWRALPPDIQEVVEREAENAALLQRQDVEAINTAGAVVLERLGMIVNTADSAGIRARLGDFYARWTI